MQIYSAFRDDVGILAAIPSSSTEGPLSYHVDIMDTFGHGTGHLHVSNRVKSHKARCSTEEHCHSFQPNERENLLMKNVVAKELEQSNKIIMSKAL